MSDELQLELHGIKKVTTINIFVYERCTQNFIILQISSKVEI